jgi:hypothetical protein
VTWGTWPNCKQTGKPLFWSEVHPAKEAPNNAPSLNTTQCFGCMPCTQKLEDNRSAAKEAQKILLLHVQINQKILNSTYLCLKCTALTQQSGST